MAGGESTFAHGPNAAAGYSDGLERDLATSALSEKTGRAILAALETANFHLDQIRRTAAAVAGELPVEPPNPSIGA